MADDYVIGIVKKIIYRSNTGYCVGVFKVKDTSDSFNYLR